jgi:hypothetical protein
MKRNIKYFLREEKDANPAVAGVLFEMDIILFKKKSWRSVEADGIITFTNNANTKQA